MKQLLRFLYRFRTFILFLLLEALSFWLIVQNNSYQGARYFNTANAVSARLAEWSHSMWTFIHLSEQNRLLAEENARLKTLIYNLVDSALTKVDTIIGVDSAVWYVEAVRVVNNSIFLNNNHITISKGRADGVRKSMGVIGSTGAVGQVIDVSENFASVASILHGASLLSSLHKPSNSLCTTAWDGQDPTMANIQYLPRHLDLQRGDTIVSSGFDGLYPPNTLIGTVAEASIAGDAPFYNVKLKLATDFYTLSQVYLVKYRQGREKDSIELRYE